MDTLTNVVLYGSFVIAGIVVALNGIAPLTKSTKDDKLRDALRWVQDRLLVLILPMMRKPK